MEPRPRRRRQAARRDGADHRHRDRPARGDDRDRAGGGSAWGDRIPSVLLACALWGSASAKLVYPVAELVAKLLILASLIDVSGGGVADMTATGWLNFAAVWLVFGVPGALFVLTAGASQRRRGVGRSWAVVGGVAGVGFLAATGAAIG